MSASPYAPPKAPLRDADVAAEGAEAIREAHIRHEVSLKSVGTLYLLGGAVLLLVALVGATALLAEVDTGAAPMMVGVFGLYAVLAALQLALGVGYRRLRPWVRVPGGILSALGLLAIPVGTLINGYILYLMFSRRGQVILAPGYAAVVAATPHVRYRRTVGDWIALGIVVLLLACAIVLVALSAMR